jgi:putative NIF3 family GTP cyclohydrolase 1 type 2
MVDDALAQGADLYLTGEMRHHDALRAAKQGMTVVCALHSNSERAALVRIRDRIAGALPDLAVAVSAEDRDPFVVL